MYTNHEKTYYLFNPGRLSRKDTNPMVPLLTQGGGRMPKADRGWL